jgi:hypothetical protein
MEHHLRDQIQLLEILAVGCKKHPSYRAVRPATGRCDACLKMWHAKQGLENAVLAFDLAPKLSMQSLDRLPEHMDRAHYESNLGRDIKLNPIRIKNASKEVLEKQVSDLQNYVTYLHKETTNLSFESSKARHVSFELKVWLAMLVVSIILFIFIL